MPNSNTKIKILVWDLSSHYIHEYNKYSYYYIMSVHDNLIVLFLDSTNLLLNECGLLTNKLVELRNGSLFSVKRTSSLKNYTVISMRLLRLTECSKMNNIIYLCEFSTIV